MDIRFDRELDGSYLVITETPPGDSIAAHMVAEAHPEPLLRMRLEETEEQAEYSYEISGMRSLENLLATREMEAGEIRELMESIYCASSQLEEYLLSPDQLWLEPGLMYSGKEGWRFLLDPARSEDFFQQMQVLSRYILKKCDHGDPETSRIAYELFRVCHEDNYSFGQIWEALEMNAAPEALPEPETAEPEPVPPQKSSALKRLFGIGR